MGYTFLTEYEGILYSKCCMKECLEHDEKCPACGKDLRLPFGVYAYSRKTGTSYKVIIHISGIQYYLGRKSSKIEAIHLLNEAREQAENGTFSHSQFKKEFRRKYPARAVQEKEQRFIERPKKTHNIERIPDVDSYIVDEEYTITKIDGKYRPSVCFGGKRHDLGLYRSRKVAFYVLHEAMTEIGEKIFEPLLFRLKNGLDISIREIQDFIRNTGE